MAPRHAAFTASTTEFVDGGEASGIFHALGHGAEEVPVPSDATQAHDVGPLFGHFLGDAARVGRVLQLISGEAES